LDSGETYVRFVPLNPEIQSTIDKFDACLDRRDLPSGIFGIYSFGVTKEIVLDKRGARIWMQDSPSCIIRINRVTMNVPSVGFATVNSILLGNVAVTIGGAEDAYAYNESDASKVDYPTLHPIHNVSVSGQYHGRVLPPGYEYDQKYVFSARFVGRCYLRGGCAGLSP
jgi:hypothetical protein